MSLSTTAAENTTTTTTENNKKKKTITLTSGFSNSEKFELDESLAMTSETVAYLIEEEGFVDKDIIVSNAPPEILKKVIEYWKKHAGATVDDDLKQWDEDFFIDVDDQKTLFDIITLSVISEGGKSLFLETPLNKAIRVSHGQPIPLLKSVVAVPYYQDFTFSASLGCPNNIDDSALYFPTVNASVTFLSDSDSDDDDDENEDDPGLDTLDEDDPDLCTLEEEEEEVPVLDTHEGAASVPCKFYVFRKVIYGTGGFHEVNATVDMQ